MLSSCLPPSFAVGGTVGIDFYAVTGEGDEVETTCRTDRKDSRRLGMGRVAKLSDDLIVGSSWERMLHDATLFRVVDCASLGKRLESVRCFERFQGKGVRVWGLACVPTTGFDSPRIVTGAGGRATVWDSKSGTMITDLPSPPIDFVYCIRCAPDWDNEVQLGGGKMTSSAGGDNTIRRYDLTRGEVTLKHPGHKLTTTGLDIDLPRSALISVSKDETCCVWSRQEPKAVLALNLPERGYSVLSMADRNLVVVGLWQSQVQLWDLRSPAASLSLWEVGTKYQQVWDLARVSHDTFVSVAQASNQVNSLGGKKLHTAGARGRGVCGFGTEYDRGMVSNMLGADEEERLQFCLQTVVPLGLVRFPPSSGLVGVRFYRWRDTI